MEISNLDFSGVPGFDLSWWIAKWIFAFIFVASVIGIIGKGLWTGTIPHKFVLVLVCATVGAAGALFVFMAVFSTLNFFWGSDYTSWSAVRSWVVNGGAALTVSSALIGYHGIITTLQLGQSLGPEWEGEWNNAGKKAYFYTIQFLQVSIYACGIVLLTVYKILQVTSVWHAALAWLIFFIMDDWRITKYYASRLNGHIPWTTIFVFVLANAGIISLASTIVINWFSALAMIPYALMLVCPIWMYFVWREEQQEVKPA